jgi:hypothetical protein
MALHRLTGAVIGVPEIEPVAQYYEAFGLARAAGAARFATVDGGEQLEIVAAPRRRLLEFGIGADDEDDIARVAANLAKLGVACEHATDRVVARDAGTDVRVVVTIAPRLGSPAIASSTTTTRVNVRAGAVLREEPVRPRKLGHVVVGSTDLEASERFFIEGIGFKVSDTVAGLASFLRCSTDHHNLLVQAAPIPLLHHTSWQVDDVDEIGRGASALLAGDPARHVWGLGRHHIGSNFFWYLKDPAGNFTEYYADLDVIVDDELWEPGVWEGQRSLYSWGPPVPGEFLAPDDILALLGA